jgi:hypothetical protein
MSDFDRPRTYFHAKATYMWRKNRFYRIYVRSDELWFIEGGSSITPELALQNAAMHGLVGGVVGGIIAHNVRKRTNARQSLLDAANDDELGQLAAAEKPNFRALIGDLSDMRIEPKSIWHGIAYSNMQHAGLLHFTHPEYGTVKLEFASPTEVRAAIDLLKPVFGDRLKINVVWDGSKQAFVGRT